MHFSAQDFCKLNAIFCGL